MEKGTLTSVALAAAVFLLSFLSLKLLPFPDGKPSGKSLEQLVSQYGKTIRITVLASVLALVPVGGLIYFALLTAYSLFGPGVAKDSLVLSRMPPAYWGLISIFLGIVLTAIGSLLVVRKHLGSDVRLNEFDELSNRMQGTRLTKFYRPIYGSLLALCILGIIFGFRNINEIRRDSIYHTRTFSLFPDEYQISDVTGIFVARSTTDGSGKLIRQPHYVLKFRNGDIWSINERDDSWLSNQDLIGAMKYVSEKSRVPIEERESDAELK